MPTQKQFFEEFPSFPEFHQRSHTEVMTPEQRLMKANKQLNKMDYLITVNDLDNTRSSRAIDNPLSPLNDTRSSRAVANHTSPDLNDNRSSRAQKQLTFT